jgi:hypothetical protein
MATKILSDDDMNECRRLYERDGLGYGRLAQKYGMTKAGIQSLVRRGKWQRDAGVLPAQKGAQPVRGDGDSTAKVTEVPVIGSRADGMHTAGPSENRPALAAPAPSADGDDLVLPEGWEMMSLDEQREAAERIVRERQAAMQGVQRKALTACRATLNKAIVAAHNGDKDAFTRVRAAKFAISAMAEAHAEEIKQETARTMRQLGRYHGRSEAGTPCRIVVILSHDNPLTGHGSDSGDGRAVHCGEGHEGAVAAFNMANGIEDVVAKEIPHA